MAPYGVVLLTSLACGGLALGAVALRVVAALHGGAL